MTQAVSASGTVRRNPILVTGAHRSGSTWVGRMIATSRAVRYLHEPFNPDAFDPAVCEVRFEREFSYVCSQNAAPYGGGLERCLRLRPEPPRDLAIRRIRRLGRLTLDRIARPRPLMKDPHAVFSADWLAETFGMDVVVLIRHPAAFVGSIKKAGWSFRFEQLLEQPLLMKHHLAGFRREIETLAHEAGDIVDQGILLWNVIYQVIAGYRERHPDWIYVRHEDLSRDPLPAFGELFESLGLDYTKAVQRVVAEHSGSNNPVEPHAGSEIRRHSRANIQSWKQRLSAEEIRRIERGTAEVAAHFYGEEDW